MNKSSRLDCVNKDLSANASKSPSGRVMRAVWRCYERTLTIVDGTRSKGVRVLGPPVGATFRSVKFYLPQKLWFTTLKRVK